MNSVPFKTSAGTLREREQPDLAEAGQVDVYTGPEPSAQVGGAGQDVAQPLAPHELPAPLHDPILHLETANPPCYCKNTKNTGYSFRSLI